MFSSINYFAENFCVYMKVLFILLGLYLNQCNFSFYEYVVGYIILIGYHLLLFSTYFDVTEEVWKVSRISRGNSIYGFWFNDWIKVAFFPCSEYTQYPPLRAYIIRYIISSLLTWNPLIRNENLRKRGGIYNIILTHHLIYSFYMQPSFCISLCWQ